MQNTEVGKLLDETARRDAIHIAVAPVTANERLSPGQLVGYSEGVVSSLPPHIGIVDPFLKGAVMPGDRFYIFLNPNTITSLRHEWVHPAFPEFVPVSVLPFDKEASEAWLRNFCDQNDRPGYDTLMEIIINGESGSGYNRSYLDGDYIHIGGSDAHGEIPLEFWIHAEIVTGKKFKNKATFFSCSC